ncbi:uncharacterized protein LOC124413068 [Diprion similis]|uniref:uncharacterized protein LOC124413068 n=1 Tax=Diprion similis TaxID=362088 RepID=UPI001EF78839|nr:uncharacterized protein LOC124413068 [Diprion similis]
MNMKSSQKSSDNLLRVEDGLAWQKKSKDPLFVSVLSYESRVTKCFKFSFILLTIALVGIVAYELQQTIRTEYLITDAEVQATEIIENTIQNETDSTNDSDLQIRSTVSTIESFSKEYYHSSEESKEEQISEKIDAETFGDSVDETSDFLKQLQEDMKNIDLDQVESIERLLKKIESIHRQMEMDQIPEENGSITVPVDEKIENPVVESSEVFTPVPDDWMAMFPEMTTQELEKIVNDTGIVTIFEENDSSDDYPFDEDSYEDYNDYYSAEKTESKKDIIAVTSVPPETVEVTEEVIDQEMDSDYVESSEDFFITHTESPAINSTDSVVLDWKNFTDENPNEPTGSENIDQTTDSGSDRYDGDDWIADFFRRLSEKLNDEAENLNSDHILLDYNHDDYSDSVDDVVSDRWLGYRSVPSYGETASFGENEYEEEYGEDDYDPYPSSSDYHGLRWRRSIPTSTVNDERLVESHSYLEKSAKLITEMRKTIDEDNRILHDLVSVASEPAKQVLQAELHDFYKRMEAVTTHIDRLHERYLRLNELTDDYVSKEFPESKEVNDDGYRF